MGCSRRSSRCRRGFRETGFRVGEVGRGEVERGNRKARPRGERRKSLGSPRPRVRELNAEENGRKRGEGGGAGKRCTHLNTRSLEPNLSRLDGRGVAARASADDNHVKVVCRRSRRSEACFGDVGRRSERRAERCGERGCEHCWAVKDNEKVRRTKGNPQTTQRKK